MRRWASLTSAAASNATVVVPSPAAFYHRTSSPRISARSTITSSRRTYILRQRDVHQHAGGGVLHTQMLQDGGAVVRVHEIAQVIHDELLCALSVRPAGCPPTRQPAIKISCIRSERSSSAYLGPKGGLQEIDQRNY